MAGQADGAPVQYFPPARTHQTDDTTLHRKLKKFSLFRLKLGALFLVMSNAVGLSSDSTSNRLDGQICGLWSQYVASRQYDCHLEATFLRYDCLTTHNLQRTNKDPFYPVYFPLGPCSRLFLSCKHFSKKTLFSSRGLPLFRPARTQNQ